MIYFDNASTTPVCEAAKAAALTSFDITGNPSSLHSLGLAAEKSLTSSRKIIAGILGCDPSEIIFTSGGTESNNLAILGAARARKRLGNKVVITSAEHSSVYESAKFLESEGFEIVCIRPLPGGGFSPEELANIDNKTILVSAVHTNNETGAPTNFAQINEAIINAAKSAPKKAIFHTDAIQAFCKETVTPLTTGADLISVSAHKIGGIKGAGALYIKKGITLRPLLYGGEQERGIRAGTEAAELMAAFAAAAEYRQKQDDAGVYSLNNELRKYISGIPGAVIHSPENGSPYILNFSAGQVKSQTMLHFLESRGIFVSSGSACDKGRRSRILLGAGISPGLADTAIRLSFSPENTPEEVAEFIEAFKAGMKILVKK